MSYSPRSVATRAKSMLEDKVDAARRGESSADDFFSALVEGAFLLGAADGELSEEEVSTLGETIAFVTGEAMDPSEFVEMIDAFAEALADSSIAARARAIAEALPDAAARREVLVFAVTIALCDDDFAQTEREAVSTLAAALGLGDGEAAKVLAEVEQALAAG
ncbi:MAG: TerB family tellurite resistance protein [Polyangiaceae bacterium]|nr:TerB family tellurite resistance protein [Polyangiaceae bacterium]